MFSNALTRYYHLTFHAAIVLYCAYIFPHHISHRMLFIAPIPPWSQVNKEHTHPYTHVPHHSTLPDIAKAKRQILVMRIAIVTKHFT